MVSDHPFLFLFSREQIHVFQMVLKASATLSQYKQDLEADEVLVRNPRDAYVSFCYITYNLLLIP